MQDDRARPDAGVQDGGSDPGPSAGQGGAGALDGGATATAGGTGATDDPRPLPLLGCPHPTDLPPSAGERHDACWDIPNAPSAEHCPASAAEELGERCCVPGGCGFDFGAGCTFEPVQLAGDLEATAPPCAGGVVEKVFAGATGRVALGREALFVLEPLPDASRITRVARRSCRPSVIHEGPGALGQMQPLDDFLFVVTANGEQLLQIDATGSVEELRLASLFDAGWVSYGTLATDGTSLFVQVNYGDDGAPSTEVWGALVAVPCCGAEPPRVISAEGILAGGSTSEVGFDGSKLLFVQQELVLDVGPITDALAVDPTTGEVTHVIDGYRGSLLPSALVQGVLYTGRDRGITGLSIDDCASTTLVSRAEAEQVSAMTTDGTWVYWAESYAGLSGGRIFRMQPGADPERLVQTAARVDWLGVDAQHLYWREADTLARQASSP